MAEITAALVKQLRDMTSSPMMECKKALVEAKQAGRSLSAAERKEFNPLLSALSRPLISKYLVEAAHTYGAAFVAHGCTGKGNDQLCI